MEFLHIYPPMKMEKTVCSKTSAYKFRRWEIPRRKHTTFKTRQKFEIMTISCHDKKKLCVKQLIISSHNKQLCVQQLTILSLQMTII